MDNKKLTVRFKNSYIYIDPVDYKAVEKLSGEKFAAWIREDYSSTHWDYCRVVMFDHILKYFTKTRVSEKFRESFNLGLSKIVCEFTELDIERDKDPYNPKRGFVLDVTHLVEAFYNHFKYVGKPVDNTTKAYKKIKNTYLKMLDTYNADTSDDIMIACRCLFVLDLMDAPEIDWEKIFRMNNGAYSHPGFGAISSRNMDRGIEILPEYAEGYRRVLNTKLELGRYGNYSVFKFMKSIIMSGEFKKAIKKIRKFSREDVDYIKESMVRYGYNDYSEEIK